MDAPAFSKRTGVNHIETEPVDQIDHTAFCDWIVSGDRQRPSVGRTRRHAVGRDLAGRDVVEGFHHVGARQPGLEQPELVTLSSSRAAMLPSRRG